MMASDMTSFDLSTLGSNDLQLIAEAVSKILQPQEIKPTLPELYTPENYLDAVFRPSDIEVSREVILKQWNQSQLKWYMLACVSEKLPIYIYKNLDAIFGPEDVVYNSAGFPHTQVNALLVQLPRAFFVIFNALVYGEPTRPRRVAAEHFFNVCFTQTIADVTTVHARHTLLRHFLLYSFPLKEYLKFFGVHHSDIWQAMRVSEAYADNRTVRLNVQTYFDKVAETSKGRHVLSNHLVFSTRLFVQRIDGHIFYARSDVFHLIACALHRAGVLTKYHLSAVKKTGNADLTEHIRTLAVEKPLRSKFYYFVF